MGLYRDVADRLAFNDTPADDFSSTYKSYGDRFMARDLYRKKNKCRQNLRKSYPLQDLILDYNGICQLCFKPVVEPTRDHIVSLARGGSNQRHNIQLACKKCNEDKGMFLTPKQMRVRINHLVKSKGSNL